MYCEPKISKYSTPEWYIFEHWDKVQKWAKNESERTKLMVDVPAEGTSKSPEDNRKRGSSPTDLHDLTPAKKVACSSCAELKDKVQKLEATNTKLKESVLKLASS